MKIGARIRSARRRQKLSQEQLAQACGRKPYQIYRQNISRYERGEAVPSLPVLQRLALALGVSLDDLTSERRRR